jgi:hypothetical protein
LHCKYNIIALLLPVKCKYDILAMEGQMPYNSFMPKENFTFRFDPDLISAIDSQGKKENRSRTNMLEVMAMEYLRAREVPASGDTPVPTPQARP